MNRINVNDPLDVANAVKRLEIAVNYEFKDKTTLVKALTHSSFSNELKAKNVTTECNERLEFFGDSILSLIVSEYLYTNYADLPEGELSKVRAGAVCEKALAKFAREIDLGKFLFLGRGEEASDGRNKPAILADAFEALLASIYIDGGISPVKSFLLPFAEKEIDRVLTQGAAKDYKTMLQQFIQQERGDVLEYRLLSENGPAHARLFESGAFLNNNIVGKGVGKSKRESEQNAAKEALSLFGQN